MYLGTCHPHIPFQGGKKGDRMNEGRIIEYIDQSRFVCSLCLKDKGSKLHLLTLTNREVNLSFKRALLISDSVIDISMPREDMLECLKQEEHARNSYKDQVNVKDLWELIKDEDESFDHRYLTHLVFGESISDEHISALVRALFENRLFFKMKDGRFLPNSEERVEQIIRQREEDALREERLVNGANWIADVLKGKQPPPPACKDYVIDLLTQMALYGREAQEFKHGKELLSRAGTNTSRAREILIRLGVWEEDENIDLLRLGFSVLFGKKVLEEAGSLKNRPLPLGGREDLRDLFTVTIDSAETRDFDDAVSLMFLENGYSLCIHIADVAQMIEVGGPIDDEAKTRAQSIYLPRRQIPMMPPEISEDLLSLTAGKDRLAVSLFVNMDRSCNILDYRFTQSIIRVDRRMTYNEVDEILNRLNPAQAGSDTVPGEGIADDLSEGDEIFPDKEQVNLFHEMYRIAILLQKKRMDMGALNLSLPDLQVRFDNDPEKRGKFTLALVPQDTPARTIIAEFMILYNCLAGRLCRDNDIPALFRAQAEPNELLSQDKKGHVFYVFQQRQKLSPLQITTTSAPHSGLGVDSYVQASSPLRRELDLVAQHQIKSFLDKTEAVYTHKELNEIKQSVLPTIKAGQMLSRNRQRYWTVKFLSQHIDKQYKAVVIHEMRNMYRVVLTDFLLVTEVKRKNGVLLNLGDEIWVAVKKADPWEGLLVIDYVGKNRDVEEA